MMRWCELRRAQGCPWLWTGCSPGGRRPARSAPRSGGRYRPVVPPDPVTSPSTRPPAVSVQLFGVHGIGIAAALWRMAVDRRRLRDAPGLRFFKLLGTGDGRTFDVRDADPRLWGLLTVWDDPRHRDRFMAESTTVGAWRALSHEQWRVDLVPTVTKGRWSGRNPFTPTATRRPPGPVAAITRARLRPRRAVQFWRSVPPVTAALREAGGLLLSVGIGEAPVGLQGTFSVWRDEASLTAFAYRTREHRRVIAATEESGWYAEDLFARFGVTAGSGTVGGADPLGPADYDRDDVMPRSADGHPPAGHPASGQQHAAGQRTETRP